MIQRRAFIALLGVSVVGGCLENAAPSGDGGSGDGQAGGAELIDSLSRTWVVEEDRYRGQEFELPDGGRVEYSTTVRDGPRVDFYVMDMDEYDHFENGDRFRYYSRASDPDSAGTDVSATLGSGRYAFVVDNSELGEASPPTNFDEDPSRVEVDLELYG